MNEADIEYLRKFAAEAPPLSPAQRDLIRRICALTLPSAQRKSTTSRRAA